MICSNSELSSLDDNLSKIYKKTLDVTENKEYLKAYELLDEDSKHTYLDILKFRITGDYKWITDDPSWELAYVS